MAGFEEVTAMFGALADSRERPRLALEWLRWFELLIGQVRLMNVSGKFVLTFVVSAR